MTELEKLLQQKEELERKIAEAKCAGTVILENVKLFQNTNKYSSSCGKWAVSVRCRDTDSPKQGGYFPIIKGNSREAVISLLPQTIVDLQELCDRLQIEGA